MKQLKLTILLFVFSLSLIAQVNKGAFMIEAGINMGGGQSVPFIGTTGFSLRSADNYSKDASSGTPYKYWEPRSYNYSLSPRIGYVLTKNLLIGGDFQYYKNRHRLKNYDHTTDTYSSAMYGTFIRKYFGNGKLLPLIEAGIGIGRSKNISDETSPGGALFQETERRNLFYFSGAAGISYTFYTRLRANLHAKVQQTEERPINTEHIHFANSKIINVDTGMVLSFSYFINKK